MTEAEWRSTVDLEMLSELYTGNGPERIGKRKARLYAVSCLRLVHTVRWTEDESVCASLNLVERYADGHTTDRELLDSYTELQPVILGNHSNPGDVLLTLLDFRPPGGVIFNNTIANALEFWREHSLPAILLRDIFGSPFHPAAFDPSWRTDTAFSLARQMYESRDFSAMPILADALQDADCDCNDILTHCRGDGPHVRGCWVVDLVLGRE